MATTTTSVFMLMVLPTPLQEPGPTYAQDLVNALNVVDVHDHSSGKGTQVTPAGLNITSDLSMKGTGTTGNNLTNARSVRLEAQGSPLGSLSADRGAVHRSGNELYYVDGTGVAVRITLNGSVDTSASGNITGMGGTGAGVAYSNGSKTFAFTQSAGVAAKMDFGDLSLRDTTTPFNAATLKAPAGLAAGYTLTLPAALPAAVNTTLLTLDNTGAIAASLAPALTCRPTFAGLNPGNTADTTAGNVRWTGADLQLYKSIGGTPQWANVHGWDFLGGYSAVGDVGTTGAISIAARDELMIVVRRIVPSALVGGAAIRFNADSAANYRSRFVSIASGGVALTNLENVSQTSMAIESSGFINEFHTVIFVSNRLASTKIARYLNQNPSGFAATSALSWLVAEGEWANAAAQITSVEVLKSSSTNVFGAGSGVAIFGRSFT